MDLPNDKESAGISQLSIEDLKPELLKLIEEKIKKSDEKKYILAGLKYALDNQIGWQKYAEAKTLILCTVSATTLVNLAKYILENTVSSIGFYFFFVTSSISFIISALSLMTRKYLIPNDDAYYISYWGYAREKKYEELLELVKNYDEDHQIKDLTYAHLIGSKLTYRKYRLFNKGMKVYLLGLFVFIVFLALGHFIKLPLRWDFMQ